MITRVWISNYAFSKNDVFWPHIYPTRFITQDPGNSQIKLYMFRDFAYYMIYVEMSEARTHLIAAFPPLLEIVEDWFSTVKLALSLVILSIVVFLIATWSFALFGCIRSWFYHFGKFLLKGVPEGNLVCFRRNQGRSIGADAEGIR